MAAQFHVRRKVAQAQQGVDPVEPVLKFRQPLVDDVRAGVVEAVAHVVVAGELVPQDIADDGLSVLVKVYIHGVFIAINIFFQQPVVAVNHRLRVLRGPALRFCGNGAFGGMPVFGVADAVDPKAEKSHGGLEHTGRTQGFEGQGLHFCQVQTAVVIVRVQRAQQFAGERLVLELGYGFGQGRGAVLRHPGQGIFGAGIQAGGGCRAVGRAVIGGLRPPLILPLILALSLILPAAQHGCNAVFGHKVEHLSALHFQIGGAGPRHVVV